MNKTQKKLKKFFEIFHYENLGGSTGWVEKWSKTDGTICNFEVQQILNYLKRILNDDDDLKYD